VSASLPESTDPFDLVGTTVADHFLVESVVCDRASGVVYKATHVAKDEPVTLTVYKLPLVLEASQKDTFVMGFRDETRAHSKLLKQHPQFARSIGTGVIRTGEDTGLGSPILPYVVTEWLGWHSLADNLAERRASADPLAIGGVVELFFPAVDAIAAMHDLGLFHGDLHPGSMLLSESAGGRVLKVLDFGVAKVLADLVGTVAPDAPRDQLFTPLYGAPEHFDDGTPLSPATDVYCVALVLLEALCNQAPVEGATRQELEAVARDPHRRPTARARALEVADIGDALERVIRRAVAVDPKERWQNAGELRAALKTAVDEDLAAATPKHTPEASAPATPRMVPPPPSGEELAPLTPRASPKAAPKSPPKAVPAPPAPKAAPPPPAPKAAPAPPPPKAAPAPPPPKTAPPPPNATQPTASVAPPAPSAPVDARKHWPAHSNAPGAAPPGAPTWAAYPSPQKPSNIVLIVVGAAVGGVALLSFLIWLAVHA
jgi:eukaryotic-like serine/threonine-protein kinase